MQFPSIKIVSFVSLNMVDADCPDETVRDAIDQNYLYFIFHHRLMLIAWILTVHIGLEPAHRIFTVCRKDSGEFDYFFC